MKKESVVGSGYRAMWLCVLGVVLLGSAAATRAQSSSDDLDLKLTPEAYAKAADATVVYHHSLPANTPAGRSVRAKETATVKPDHANDGGGNSPIQNPGDMSYLGGETVGYAQFHAIYMLPGGVCPISTCWGNPEGYLRDLGESNFIDLADQYVGTHGPNRFTVGFRAKVTYTPPSVPLTDNDIEAVVYLVASATGDTGYGHIYHVFLPPGQDQCFTSADTECYSPDNPAVFFYCGYHNSVTFSDIGHVLYTVEPYQNVAGCQVKPGTPNGMLVDSTDNVLNHESFETITDPDGTAWINTSALVMYGDEVGDECEFVTFVGASAYFNPPIFRVNGTPYGVQSIYSNALHACGTGPAH